jgi:hypothetical protein
MLRLPEIRALVTSNSLLIRGRLRLALADLTDGALDRSSLRRRRRELDKLLRMPEEQRNVLEAFDGGAGGAEVLYPPATTHLELFRDAVARRDFAAASPWFDRYCERAALQALGVEVKEAGPSKKWRGPLNRGR